MCQPHSKLADLLFIRRSCLQLSGDLDQSGSMLSEEIAEKGYALLCVAQPKSDCKVQTISEDELLEQQFGM